MSELTLADRELAKCFAGPEFKARHVAAVDAQRDYELKVCRPAIDAIKALGSIWPSQVAQICAVLSAKVDQSGWSHQADGLSEHLDSASDMATDIHNRQNAL